MTDLRQNLTPGEKVVVTVFVAVLAIGAGAVGFLAAAVFDMKDDIGELRGDIGELGGELRGEMGELRGEIGEFRAEMEARLTRLETLIEAHFGSSTRRSD